MNIIIVGCGRVGSRIALKMAEEGHNVSIIDKNPLAFERVASNDQITTILGTGIDCDVLECAGINGADALVAVTNGDNTNIMAAQIAESLYKVPKAIARIVDPRVKEFYEKEMGITCYCHTLVSSDHYIGMLKGEGILCTLL
ncbi:MAG: TrkA family potassium uptake protein [Clostridiales bacterium]|nr:TrkA family potassium uptake protein [Clostridiales bacterium]